MVDFGIITSFHYCLTIFMISHLTKIGYVMEGKEGCVV